MTATEDIVVEILDEVTRAGDRFGNYSMGGPTLTDLERYAVLSEEVGEVAEAIVIKMREGRFAIGREGHETDLESELIQVAAICIGWLRSKRR